MDPVSAAASVAGLATTAGHLSKALFQFCQDVKDAEKDISDVANSVQLLSVVLKELHDLFQPQIRADPIIHNRGIYDSTREICDRCERIFEDIENATNVQRGEMPKPSVIAKLKWCFQKNRVKLLQANLESLKSTLNIILQLIVITKLGAPTVYHSDAVSSIRREKRLLISHVVENRDLVEDLDYLERLELMLPNRTRSAESLGQFISRNGNDREHPRRERVAHIEPDDYPKERRRNEVLEDSIVPIESDSQVPQYKNPFLAQGGADVNSHEHAQNNISEDIGTAGFLYYQPRTSEIVRSWIPHEMDHTRKDHTLNKLDAAERTSNFLIEWYTPLSSSFVKDQLRDEKDQTVPSIREGRPEAYPPKTGRHVDEKRPPPGPGRRSPEEKPPPAPEWEWVPADPPRREWNYAHPPPPPRPEWYSDQANVPPRPEWNYAQPNPPPRPEWNYARPNPPPGPERNYAQANPPPRHEWYFQEANAAPRPRWYHHEERNPPRSEWRAHDDPIPEKAEEPIKFKDAVGRKFTFPWKQCKTWKGMDDLIQQAFLHVEGIGDQVQAGHFDIMGPDDEIILPRVWPELVEPGWSISMHMWPMAEELKPKEEAPPPPEPPPAPGLWGLGSNNKSKKKTPKEPVVLKDFLGRTFEFPIDHCRSWKAMHRLIESSFSSHENLVEAIRADNYDLLKTSGEIILPEVWGTVIQPGLTVELRIRSWENFRHRSSWKDRLLFRSGTRTREKGYSRYTRNRFFSKRTWARWLTPWRRRRRSSFSSSDVSIIYD